MLWKNEEGLQLIPYIIAWLAIIFFAIFVQFLSGGLQDLGKGYHIEKSISPSWHMNIWRISRPDKWVSPATRCTIVIFDKKNLSSWLSIAYKHHEKQLSLPYHWKSLYFLYSRRGRPGNCKYRHVSNIRCTIKGNIIVDHLDVVGASPVGAAPTTSSFSTEHLTSIYCAKTTVSRDGKHSICGSWCSYIKDFTVLVKRITKISVVNSLWPSDTICLFSAKP